MNILAEFAKKLRVKYSNGSTQEIKIYSTTSELGYPHTEYCKVDGVNGYIPGSPSGDTKVYYKEHGGTTGRLMTTGIPPYGKATYSSPGTYTFTVPKGVSKLRCEIVGAGGGGADGKSAGNNGWVIIEYGQGVQ